MKIEIVQFTDGTYAVRKTKGFLWWKSYLFLDFHNIKDWWPAVYRNYFTVTDLNKAKSMLQWYKDYGVPIKED